MVVSGISASMSMTFDMDAGMASCIGSGAAGAAEGEGRVAARAAAMEVAILCCKVDERIHFFAELGTEIVMVDRKRLRGHANECRSRCHI